MSEKREEYISWDAYFLGLAAMASFRSKDPSTQNGACVVDPDSLSPLSLGYNGFPRGCSDDDFPWGRDSDKPEETKYPYVEHAERNAIFNAARKGISLDGSIMYIYSEKGYYPCDECARAIIQSGITRVIMGWAIDGETDKYSWGATQRMFKEAGVTVNVICKGVNQDSEVDESLPEIERELSQMVVDDFSLIQKKVDTIHTQLWKKGGK